MKKSLKMLRPFKKSDSSKDNSKKNLNNSHDFSDRRESPTVIDQSFSDTSSRSDSTHGTTPSNQYGYGDAAPDSAAVVDYGYGDAAPDSADKYGYGDAAPDSADKYGNGDASPDSAANEDRAKYGYGDASSPTGRTCTLRRSSMKQEGRARRASIQLGGGREMELNVPGEKKPVRRRASITFSEKARVKQVQPVHELTETPEALWFQDHEYKEIKHKLRTIVNNTDNGMVGNKKYCTRGLERVLSQEAQQLSQETKYMVWDTVLMEQDLQRDNDHHDVDYMGNLVKFHTRKSQQAAVDRANQDAMEVEKYLRQTRRTCRRMSM